MVGHDSADLKKNPHGNQQQERSLMIITRLLLDYCS